MDTDRVAIYQTARVRLRIGKSIVSTAKVQLTPAGMLSIAAIVSSTLLSSAVLVGTILRTRR